MKILLCCNSGMSSSILVKKMKDAAQIIGEDIVIKAIPGSAIGEEVGLWDLCLVGPQLVYAVSVYQELLNIPVAAIDAKMYSMADGEGIIRFAREILE
ncbi:MAG: PTS sugar transporter subunit IIB [Bacillota bacterium]|nr:PTS sugar transporter subunit IIB [Bacillota bacterium]